MPKKCLFCPTDLDPGSPEHVFLAALGGRLTTRAALCQPCNNHFATDAGGKIDDAVADAFRLIRCGLMIWTGRDKPPPTLQRAGHYPDGGEYDLAPGFVPVTRRAAIPDLSGIKPGDVVTVTARDSDDVRRVMGIVRRRGHHPVLHTAKAVQTKAPLTEFNIEFESQKTCRAVAKTAATGAVVLFGNEIARAHLDPSLLISIRDGSPNIENYAGWDNVNPWPTAAVTNATPADPRPSGFEHSLAVMDVGSGWIAYVTLFGAFKFSVRLGGRSGLPPKGFALNPRAFRAEYFELRVEPPEKYKPRSESSFRDEHAINRRGTSEGFNAVLGAWQREAADSHFEDLSKELADKLMAAGSDEASFNKVIADWTKRIAVLEGGKRWEEDLDTELLIREGET